MYVIRLSTAAPAGDFVLYFEFEGRLDNGIVGFYRSTYEVIAQTKKLIYVLCTSSSSNSNCSSNSICICICNNTPQLYYFRNLAKKNNHFLSFPFSKLLYNMLLSHNKFLFFQKNIILLFNNSPGLHRGVPRPCDLQVRAHLRPSRLPLLRRAVLQGHLQDHARQANGGREHRPLQPPSGSHW